MRTNRIPHCQKDVELPERRALYALGNASQGGDNQRIYTVNGHPTFR